MDLSPAEMLAALPTAGDYEPAPQAVGDNLWRLRHRHSGGWHRLKVGRGPQRHYFLEREAHWLHRLEGRLPLPRCHGLHDRGAWRLLVTDFLPGETLAQRIRTHDGRCPGHEVLLAQLVDALAVSHRAGVIHGDLKPGNLLCDGPRLQLLDWACAAPAGTRLADLPYRAYSPSYSLPAQQQGLGRLEPLHDWYACLVILRLALGGGLARPDWCARQPAHDAFADWIGHSGLPVRQRRPLERALASLDRAGPAGLV